MRQTTIKVLTMAVLLLVSAAPAQNIAPARYTVVNLGTLGGVLGGSAHSINNKEWIVGVANLSGRGHSAWSGRERSGYCGLGLGDLDLN